MRERKNIRHTDNDLHILSLLYPYNLVLEMNGFGTRKDIANPENLERLRRVLSFDHKGLEEAIETLSQDKKDMLRERFANHKHFKDVAEAMNLSKQRAAQIQASAFKDLLHPGIRPMYETVTYADFRQELKEQHLQIIQLTKEISALRALIAKYNVPVEIISGSIKSLQTAQKEYLESITLYDMYRRGLTFRAYNGLLKHGIKTAWDLYSNVVLEGANDVRYADGVGRNSYEVIRQTLSTILIEGGFVY